MTKAVFALLCFLGFGCAGGEVASVDATPTVAQVALNQPSGDPLAEKHDAAADSVLAQAGELAPGDLIVVFSNNMDGEIEPCG